LIAAEQDKRIAILELELALDARRYLEYIVRLEEIAAGGA
jgi:hypothetical protein